MATSVEFTGILVSHGGNTAGFEVDESVVTALGSGRRPKVVVTLQDHQWRSSIAFMGGQFLLGVSQENRSLSGAVVGETYLVHVELDDAPRVIEVPEDLGAALDAEPGARAAWDKLSYSHQRAHAEPIASAKAAETRARRIASTVSKLLNG